MKNIVNFVLRQDDNGIYHDPHLFVYSDLILQLLENNFPLAFSIELVNAMIFNKNEIDDSVLEKYPLLLETTLADYPQPLHPEHGLLLQIYQMTPKEETIIIVKNYINDTFNDYEVKIGKTRNPVEKAYYLMKMGLNYQAEKILAQCYNFFGYALDVIFDKIDYYSLIDKPKEAQILSKIFYESLAEVTSVYPFRFDDKGQPVSFDNLSQDEKGKLLLVSSEIIERFNSSKIASIARGESHV